MKQGIVVIITDQHDYSTTKVIDHLVALRQPYIVINENVRLQLNYLRLPDNDHAAPSFSITAINTVTGTQSDLNESNITSVWYRRGNFALSYQSEHDLRTPEPEVDAYFGRFNQEQSFITTQFLSKLLTRTFKHINKLEDNFLNKLEVLDEARKVGLKIPESLITSHKDKLQFHSEMINKSLYNPVYFRLDNGQAFGSFTELLTPDLESVIPAQFPVSFFQKAIEKLFEIRAFFLDDTFYAMVIVSQNDAQTKTDFRNYNDDMPNRFLPYQLPAVLKNKLKRLCRKLNINCGSIDIMYGTDEQYYFLEINPVGQYDMVSVPCNYNLHQKIAQYLSN